MSNAEETNSEAQGIRLRCTSIEITPNEPTILAGCDHRDRNRNHEAIHDPLMAQVFLLEGPKTSCLIVTLDLLFAGAEINRACHEAAEVYFPGASVMVFASHTHAASATDTSKPRLGRATERVVAEICQRLFGAIESLRGSSARTCLVEVRSIEVDLAINRRINRLLAADRLGLHFRTSVEGSNRNGPVDRTLSCLLFRAAEDEAVLGVLVNFPCHPVGFPLRRTVSAHYVHAIRDHVTSSSGPRNSGSGPYLERPVVGFIQGFSGDVRPKAKSTTRPARTGIRRLLAGPGYSSFTPDDYVAWLDDLRGEISRLLGQEAAVVQGDTVVAGTALAPRSTVLIGSKSDSPFVVTTLRIGPVVILGASGELVTDYATWLRAELNEFHVLLGGCMGDVVGYVPTEAMRQRGGYEADGFCRAFSASAVPEGVERSVRATLLESLRKAEVLPLGSTKN